MKTESAGTIDSRVHQEGLSLLHLGLFSAPLMLFAVDLAIGGGAYLGAWLLRIYVPLPLVQELLPQERWQVVSHPWLTLVVSQGLFLYVFGLYDDLRVTRYREIATFALAGCSLQVLTLIAVMFLTSSPSEAQQIVGIFPRSVVLLYGFLNCVGLVAWRTLVKHQLQQKKVRVLVVGPQTQSAAAIVEEIRQNPWMGLEIVGLAVDDPDLTLEGELPPLLGSLSDTQRIVDCYRVEQIIFASEPSWKDAVLDSISQLQGERSIRIAIRPSVYEMAIGRLRHINIHDTPLIEVRRNPNEPLQRVSKRAFDVSLSLIGLVLALPLLLLVAVLIRILSPGPVFYVQDRVGRGEKIFGLIKFRTMVPDAEKESGATYAKEADPRVTPIGRVLRRFRIDELPQLVNVLKGDMSFVGPRPERPQFVTDLEQDLQGYHERHKVKPGITGLAQVRGYYHTAAENKLKYDLAYIYNYSFSLDLVILLETLKVVLIRKGS